MNDSHECRTFLSSMIHSDILELSAFAFSICSGFKQSKASFHGSSVFMFIKH